MSENSMKPAAGKLGIISVISAVVLISLWTQYSGSNFGPKNTKLIAMIDECRTHLTSRVDPDLYSGAETPGSPANTYASFRKSSSMGELGDYGIRSDIEIILGYGNTFSTCYLLDKNGFPIGTHKKKNSTFSTSDYNAISWTTKTRINGFETYFLNSRNINSDQGDKAWKTGLSVDSKTGRIFRQNRDGSAVEEVMRRSFSYKFDEKSGQLSILQFFHMEDKPDVKVHNGTKTFNAEGVLIQEDDRPCYASEPCEYAWSNTRYKRDKNGNMVSVVRSGISTNFIVTLNERGDWITSQVAGQPEKDGISYRYIVYR